MPYAAAHSRRARTIHTKYGYVLADDATPRQLAAARHEADFREGHSDCTSRRADDFYEPKNISCDIFEMISSKAERRFLAAASSVLPRRHVEPICLLLVTMARRQQSRSAYRHDAIAYQLYAAAGILTCRTAVSHFLTCRHFYAGYISHIGVILYILLTGGATLRRRSTARSIIASSPFHDVTSRC